jgi:hypothetical protein
MKTTTPKFKHHCPVSPGSFGALIFLAALLTSCGDGGNAGSPGSTEAKISGSVSDQHGAITDAKIEVTDSKGAIVATTTLSGSSQYSVTVPAGVSYPIVITAIPRGGLATTVKAVVTSPLAETQNITAVSTIVVDSAMTLGGLTEENITKASGAAIGQRQTTGGSSSGSGGGTGDSGAGTGSGGHVNH